MKINIYPIASVLHNKNTLDSQTKNLIDSIADNNHIITITNSIDELYDCDLPLILIQSGGSENEFLKIFPTLKEPYYLLTYGSNNSLAASLEILSFLNNHHLKGEVIHGDSNYISSRLNALYSPKTTIQSKYRLGVIGKPSDWLIASNVNYDQANELFSTKIINININEVEENYNSINNDDSNLNFFSSNWDKKELDKAYKLYLALKMIVDKYQLNGFTIRCFDLLSSLKTTACVALAMFNDDNIIATCEGDVPSMLSMLIAKNITNELAFQCNPSRIDVTSKKIVLAHCTIPLKMCDKYKFNTHYESGIGVGIKGEVIKGPVTIFRIDSLLEHYFIEEGYIENNLNDSNLCRTQIVCTFDNLDKILTNPLGNHEIIILGHHKQELVKYFNAIGLKNI